MSEHIQEPEPLTIDQADQYLETVRAHFVNGDALYKGSRTEEGKIIAEITSDEAELLMDETMECVLGLGFVAIPESFTEGKLPIGYEEVETAGFSWKKFRGEFSRLLVAVGIITNRLERDGFGVKSFADMGNEDRRMVAMALMRDFLAHNALRFGADGSNVGGTEKIYDEDFNVVQAIIKDKDLARTDRELKENMRRRGFVSSNATHAAGKISPAKYKELRKAHPDEDKDDFDHIIGFHQDAEKDLDERHQ